MLFTEPLFLFLFLPLLLPLNMLAGRRFGNVFLIAAGLIFYASGENGYVFLLIFCIAWNWIMGLLIGRAADARSRRALLFFGIIGNLAPLIVFRYTGFAADNLNAVLRVFGAEAVQRPEMHIPLGLSFFTFQSMAYLIDIYRRDIEPAKRPPVYALYLALFPHLIAGPIVRYRDISAQLVRRTVSRADFAEGARRFIIGLGKKRLVADTLAMRSDRIFAIPVEQLTTPLAWLGAVCYMLQIYFDFSGYSDMAIGLARMLGFTFLENFNYPYISRSVTEFWRRWHISLSTWFRDYLYIPLGGNRRGAARMYFSLLTVFVLCGFWHGARWTFIVWGLYHGMFMIIERAGLSKALARHRTLGLTYTIFVVMIGWVFFRSGTMGQALGFLGAMAGFAKGPGVVYHAGLYMGWDLALALAAGVIGSAPLFPWLSERLRKAFDERGGGRVVFESLCGVANVLLLGAVLLAVAMVVSGETFRPFLYSRF